MSKVTLIKRTESAKRFEIPATAREGDAGYDLKCTVNAGELTIDPGMALDIPTGVFIKLPPDIWAMIMPRSSVFTKKRGLLIHPGIIDCGYTGELKVLAINNSDVPIKIEDGERICQLILFNLVHTKFVEVIELPQTDRGVNGFGSTGKK